MIAYLGDFWMMKYIIIAILPLVLLMRPPKGLGMQR
jgi:hypothetical protein